MSLPAQTASCVEGLQAYAYQAIFEHAPTAMALVGPGRFGPKVLVSNPAFQALTRKAGTGQRLDRAFRGTASQQVREAAERCLGEGELVKVRIADAPAGEVIRLEVEVRPVDPRNGGRAAILTVQEIRGGAALSDLGEAGVLSELGPLSRGLVYVHDASTSTLRYGRHPLAERLSLPADGRADIDFVRARVHPDDIQRFRAYGQRQMAAPDDVVMHDTFRLQGPGGGWLWVNLRTRVLNRDLDGRVLRVLGVATDVTVSRNHAEALAEAARALAEAEQNERRRIGRELHDSTSQLLVAARLSIGAVERRIEATPEVSSLLNEARSSIADAQKEIRNLSYFLHPPWLERDGLQKALAEFAAGFAGRTGLKISVTAPEAPVALPPAVELSMFRVAQEALMNAYRHSGARSISVRLAHEARSFALEIEDDGVGIDDPFGGAQAPGVGIPGMQARMVQLGGSLTLDSNGRGLRVRAQAPLS